MTKNLKFLILDILIPFILLILFVGNLLAFGASFPDWLNNKCNTDLNRRGEYIYIPWPYNWMLAFGAIMTKNLRALAAERLGRLE